MENDPKPQPANQKRILAAGRGRPEPGQRPQNIHARADRVCPTPGAASATSSPTMTASKTGQRLADIEDVTVERNRESDKRIKGARINSRPEAGNNAAIVAGAKRLIRSALIAEATALNFHKPEDAPRFVDMAGLSVDPRKRDRSEGRDQGISQRRAYPGQKLRPPATSTAGTITTKARIQPKLAELPPAVGHQDSVTRVTTTLTVAKRGFDRL